MCNYLFVFFNPVNNTLSIKRSQSKKVYNVGKVKRNVWLDILSKVIMLLKYATNCGF